MPSVLDAEELARQANDERVAAGLRDYFPSPYTVDDALRFIDTVLAKPEPITHWLIEIEGRPAGIMSLFKGEDVYRYNAEIGYWLGYQYWGRGYGSAAIALAVEYAWSRLQVTRVYAEVFSTNPASRRVLEKNGFVHEYTLPGVVVKGGEVCDAVCLGVRRSG